MSEAGFGETDLADYDSEWSCSDDSSGQGTSIPAFDLDYGDMVTCTFTNHRKPQLNVKKVFNPSTDTGLVDFTVNGAQDTNGGAGFGHNGETGFQNVPLADNAVSEAGHGATDLATYDSTYDCLNGEQSVLSGEGTSLTNLDLNYGDEVTCTFTNNKRPLVKVVKNLEPEEDEGRFDLLISGYDPFTNGGAGFGDGGTTDFQDVDPGQVVVGEAGHGATKLSSYFLSVDCGPKGGSETDSEYEFEVAYGDEVTCVITNERRPSSIDVTKTPSPSSKPEPGGTFTYTVTVENTSDADEVTLNAASFVERVAKNTPVLETSPVVAITDLDCNGDAPEGRARQRRRPARNTRHRRA